MRFIVGCVSLIGLGLLWAGTGCGGDGGGSSIAATTKAWKAAGLEPTEFKEADAKALAAKKCHAGKVSGIYVQLCVYDKESAATDAKEQGLKTIKNRTGVSLSRGNWLLVAVDKDKVDPSGRNMNKLAKAFWKK